MAEWRRDWFEFTQNPNDPHNPPVRGGAGWIQAHPGVQVGLYAGWIMADPCSICLGDTNSTANCVSQSVPCQPDSVKLFPCASTPDDHPPRITSRDDMNMVWHNIMPWRGVGVSRIWLDFAATDADGDSTEFRDFVWNPTYQIFDPPPAFFGGEAFPRANPTLQSGRFTMKWEEFVYAPFVTSLADAERERYNGAPCPAPADPTAHLWSLPTAAYDRREGAIFPTALPKCPNGTVHPHWDGIRDQETYDYYPFERLKNLYEWYICKGFTFWEGGASTQFSGFAERLFSFGKIEPPGDFDGDGDETDADWAAYQIQYGRWNELTGTMTGCIVPGTHVLTYYHGDMDGDGEVDEDDLGLADFVIRQKQHPDPQYWLGAENTHEMEWDPNVKWLPCGCETPPSSAFGPP